MASTPQTLIQSIQVDPNKLFSNTHQEKLGASAPVPTSTTVPPVVPSPSPSKTSNKDFEVNVLRDSDGFVGIGVQKTSDKDPYIISSMIQGSPANGLIALNDQLLAVDNKSTIGKAPAEVIGLINGAPNTPVLLSVRRGTGSGGSTKLGSSGTPASPGATIVVPSIAVPAEPKIPFKDLEVTVPRNAEGLIGIVYQKSSLVLEEPYKITGFSTGSTAAKQVQVGDELHAIDGVRIDDKIPAKVSQLMLGPANSNVKLSIRRPVK